MEKIRILAIDTSCDDTSVAILENDRVMANIVSSQIDVHKEWGGVVPRLARREHEKMILGCIKTAIKRAGINLNDLTAVAVTYAPGLAPSLEVGIRWAKKIAKENDLPLIAVNHMEGHLLSVFLKNSSNKYYGNAKKLEFPLLALLVSGGNTQIVYANQMSDYKIIGQTLDDAAGEAFDKVARMLDLGYPGGPVVAEMAKKGDREKYNLPRPMSKTSDYNFSFSGLKTACLYQTNALKEEYKDDFKTLINDYCASFQEAVVDSLLGKFFRAAKKYQPKVCIVAGGVSANNRLRKKFANKLKKIDKPVYFPTKKFCTDNAAMIGLVGYHKYLRNEFVKEIDMLDREPTISIEEEYLNK